MSATTFASSGRIQVERWPSEMPLFFAVVVAAVLVWLILIVTIFGIFYAVLFGLFFFVTHLAFVSHLRGSGVRLGPDQFPELHRRIEELSRAMGMEPPAAYLVQAGGALNAFATRFLGRDMVVLYSDLLEACGEDPAARDMIIAHELAHLKCGHLRWNWLILPGYFIPFLGSALSRAREYTCDRYGMAGAGGAAGATLGLAILSAGAEYGPKVNRKAFVRQRSDTNTGFMTLGEWFSTHPPLSKRMAALDPTLSTERFHPGRGRAMALLIVTATFLVSGGAAVAAVTLGSGFLEGFEEAMRATEASEGEEAVAPVDVEEARAQVARDFESLAAFIGQQWSDGPLPESVDQVGARWRELRTDPFPLDPFDGYEYGYYRADGYYVLWSSGPDGESGTDDDIEFESGLH